MSIVKGLLEARSTLAEGWGIARRCLTAFCKERPAPKPTGLESLRRLAFKWSGFNKYGLYHDDCINPDIPEVAAAITRLPDDVLDARNFRIIRATQLTIQKRILPEEYWVTYEEDRANRYLRPYIEEVRREELEAHEFGCANYYKTGHQED